jgi:ribosomal protein S18 acetylase RimI-like enzyme
MLSLEEITDQNFDKVISLNPNSDHMTPNKSSIAEFTKLDHDKAFMNAICLDSIPIGFTMVVCEDDKIKIKRFMIDEEYQGQKLGSWAMNILLKKIFSTFQTCDRIFVATRNPFAKKFYRKFGFELCGYKNFDNKIDEYELVLHKSSWFMSCVD